MDTLVTAFNFATCASMALLACAGVLSPRVRDGVVIKLGLIALALGFGAHAWLLVDGFDLTDMIAAGRAQLLINAGMLLVTIGWILRATRVRAPKRRASDFVELDEAPSSGHVPPRPMPAPAPRKPHG